MRRKLSVLSAGAFIGILLGGGSGAAYGQFQFERAWRQMQNDPRSFHGDAGSYLCLMGDAPFVWGMLGGLMGVVMGTVGSIGWLLLRRTKF